MPPKQVKTECVCDETEKTERAHDLKDGDAWHENLVGNLGSHDTCCQENQAAFKQRDLGLYGGSPGNSVQAKTICQSISKVIKAVREQCR